MLPYELLSFGVNSRIGIDSKNPISVCAVLSLCSGSAGRFFSDDDLALGKISRSSSLLFFGSPA